MKRQLKALFLVTLSVCIILVYGVSGFAQSDDGNDGNSDTEQVITLSGSGVQPAAKGEAQIQFSKTGTASDQGIEVHANSLVKNTTYKILIDGKFYTNANSNSTGNIDIVFQNQGTDDTGDTGGSDGNSDGEQGDDNDVQLALPAELTPVTKVRLIEIVNSSDQVILSGNFSNTSSGQNTLIKSLSLVPANSIQASGKVVIHFKAKNKIQQENLLVLASGLMPDSYSVVINGHNVGKMKNSVGMAQIKFIKNKNMNSLPQEIDPITNITSVQILNSNKQVVLSGKFSN